MVLLMAESFWALTRYAEPFDPGHVCKIVHHCLEANLLLVLEVEGRVEGFAAAHLGPLLGNGATLQGLELAYWVNPGARGRGRDLLRQLERAARQAGAKYLNMVAMESSDPEKAERLYKALGYEKAETIYTKAL